MNEIINIYKIVLSYWWVVAPVALFFILKSIWLGHVRDEFLKGLKWMVLEIKIPHESIKTPKAMEQFFAGLHITKDEASRKERLLKGKIPVWHSLEITGKGGDIHFFIRTQGKFRNLIESQIYAQYPQAEILEVEDYANEMPNNIPNDDYDVAVSELVLVKPDAYPITTYPVFFEDRDEEQRNDPMASIFEFLNSLGFGENVGIQILVSPTGDDWQKEGENLVSELLGKKVKSDKKRGLIVEETVSWVEAFANGISEFFFGPGGEKKEEKAEDAAEYLSPGKKEVISAIEKNIAKPGFKTIIRFVYWAPKDIFSKDRVSAISGFFAQFNTQNLNGFKPAKVYKKPKILKKRKGEKQRRSMTWLYKKRYFPFKQIKTRGFVFNTEELATIFHIPAKFATTQRVTKVEGKKGVPPTGLPIEN